MWSKSYEVKSHTYLLRATGAFVTPEIIKTDEACSLFWDMYTRTVSMLCALRTASMKSFLLPCELVARFPEMRLEPCVEVRRQWFSQNGRAVLPWRV